MLRRFLLILGTAAFLCGAVSSHADEAAYRLYPRDVISLSVLGEPNMTTQARLSGNGSINVPLLGDVRITGLTLAAAEAKIRETYIREEIFIRPQVTLQVTEYSKKEISILGQISRQGKVELPPETATLSIIEAVSAAGGFNRIARADSVRITRKDPATDEEKTFIINVERMISGRSNEDLFYVLPGDIVFVPERLF